MSKVHPGRKILIRVDAAGCTHELLDWIVGQRLSYSVGCTLHDSIVGELAKVPEKARQPAYDGDAERRPGAWVLEVTGLFNLTRWRPECACAASARIRARSCGSPTPTGTGSPRSPPASPPVDPGRQLADLELRRRDRAEDRIRVPKDTGLTNLPLHYLDQDCIWCAPVALVCELTPWTQMLALTEHPARGGNPNGSGWVTLLLHAITRLRTLAAPADHQRSDLDDHPNQPVELAPTRGTSGEPSWPTEHNHPPPRPTPTGHDHRPANRERFGLAVAFLVRITRDNRRNPA